MCGRPNEVKVVVCSIIPIEQLSIKSGQDLKGKIPICRGQHTARLTQNGRPLLGVINLAVYVVHIECFVSELSPDLSSVQEHYVNMQDNIIGPTLICVKDGDEGSFQVSIWRFYEQGKYL